jgi:hypothetical protein
MKLLSVALPYLLLVTFYTGQLRDFGADKMAAVEASPYNGVAVPLIGAYDTGKYTARHFAPSIKRLKEGNAKDVWPWVFFNRFIGSKEGGRSLSPNSGSAYFRAIKGMDIYNEAGALGDFYSIWKIALETAKELGSPGIVVDPEAYNNYDMYKVSYISDETGLPEEEVKKRLAEIGKELARIADETYPEATLWFLFTGLGTPLRSLNPLAEKEYRSVTYIVEGMLEHAKENGSKLKFVSGGMLSLGYCSESLEDLKTKIRSRSVGFEKPLGSFPNLFLGGTIAPWDDAGLKKEGYFTMGECGNGKLKDLNDFLPLMQYLLESYKYVWIYAAGAVAYNPYDPKIAPGYNKTIAELIK